MFQEKYFSMRLIAWEDLQFLFGLTISLECLATIIIDVIVVVVAYENYQHNDQNLHNCWKMRELCKMVLLVERYRIVSNEVELMTGMQMNKIK